MTKYHQTTEEEQVIIDEAGFMAAYEVLKNITKEVEEFDQVKLCLKAYQAAILATKKAEQQLRERVLAPVLSDNNTALIVNSAFECALSGRELEDQIHYTTVGGSAIQAMIRVSIAQEHMSNLNCVLSCESDLAGSCTSELLRLLEQDE